MTHRAVPEVPGWYPDPTGRFELRYCLRGRWTNRVRQGEAEAVDGCRLDREGRVVAPTSMAWQQACEDGEWRDDPTGRFDDRWWDGVHWTRKVRVGKAVGTDVVGTPARRSTRAARRAMRGRRDGGAGDPGWYPDPEGRGDRFWDGHMWTPKRRDAPERHGRRQVLRWVPNSVVRAAVVLAIVLIGAAVLVLLVVR